MRSRCIVSCVLTSRISMKPDHIKVSISKYRKEKLPPFR
jgi:hypothetical protein